MVTIPFAASPIELLMAKDIIPHTRPNASASHKRKSSPIDVDIESTPGVGLSQEEEDMFPRLQASLSPSYVKEIK